jgi:hypothetical protein
LAEPSVELAFDEGCKPGPFGTVAQVVVAEELFGDVSEFKYGFVVLDFELVQHSGDGCLAHDTMLDLIERQKLSFVLTGVALFSIDLFELVLRKTAVDRAVRAEKCYC